MSRDTHTEDFRAGMHVMCWCLLVLLMYRIRASHIISESHPLG